MAPDRSALRERKMGKEKGVLKGGRKIVISAAADVLPQQQQKCKNVVQEDSIVVIFVFVNTTQQ